MKPGHSEAPDPPIFDISSSQLAINHNTPAERKGSNRGVGKFCVAKPNAMSYGICRVARRKRSEATRGVEEPLLGVMGAAQRPLRVPTFAKEKQKPPLSVDA